MDCFFSHPLLSHKLSFYLRDALRNSDITTMEFSSFSLSVLNCNVFSVEFYSYEYNLSGKFITNFFEKSWSQKLPGEMFIYGKNLH